MFSFVKPDKEWYNAVGSVFIFMPNWCNNTLTITGEAAEIRKFRMLAKPITENYATDISLNALYPMPGHIKKGELSVVDILRGDENNWYFWCEHNWGTKWDVVGKLVTGSDGHLEYRFLGAWDPPIKWLEKVAADFPKLTFALNYAEPDGGLLGMAKGEKGQVMHIDRSEYN
jgi:hypothetical protein